MVFLMSVPQERLMKKRFFYMTDSSCGERLFCALSLHSGCLSPTQKYFRNDNNVASVFHLILTPLWLLVTVAKVTASK